MVAITIEEDCRHGLTVVTCTPCVDVPDAKIAVIAAGLRSQRQRIQRFGRVLRATDEDTLAVSILVRLTPEERAVGGRDALLIGATRVRHFRWPGLGINEATVGRPSTYQPAAAGLDPAERIARAEMGLSQESKPSGTGSDNAISEGAYPARQVGYGSNGWYDVADVRDGIGLPHAFVDRGRANIRRLYGQTLDPIRRCDPDLIHGSEIEAIRRQWISPGRAAETTRR